jgi:hypothetical protein
MVDETGVGDAMTGFRIPQAKGGELTLISVKAR